MGLLGRNPKGGVQVKIRLVISIILDSDKESWHEHGKPFGLTKARYLKEVVGRGFVDSLETDPEKQWLSWHFETVKRETTGNGSFGGKVI